MSTRDIIKKIEFWEKVPFNKSPFEFVVKDGKIIVRRIVDDREGLSKKLPLFTNLLSFITHALSVERRESIRWRELNGEVAPPKYRKIMPYFIGKLCPLDTPESKKIGLINHLTLGAKVPIGEGEVESKFGDTEGKWIGIKLGNGKALLFLYKVEGEEFSQEVKIGEEEEIEIEIKNDDIEDIFSLAPLMVPFLQHNDGVRGIMGAKNIKQALPLLSPEEPFVKTGYENIKPFLPNELILISDRRAKEIVVEKEHVYFKDVNDKLCEEKLKVKTPQPGRCVGHPAFTVKPNGEQVDVGYPLVKFPGMKDSKLLLGVNAFVGYFPFFGYNFEDAIVISESFAEKLTSVHIYAYRVPLLGEGDIFVEENKIKVRVKGDNKIYEIPLLPEISYPDIKVERVIDEIWVTVYKKAKVGDKLTGRHGNKGVISLILPDDRMPYCEINGEKRVLDMILNPHGVISRMNIGQILETHVGFVVKRLQEEGRNNEAEAWSSTGKPFSSISVKDIIEARKKDLGKIEKIPSDWMELLSQTLRELGLNEEGKAKVHVYDLQRDRWITLPRPVTVGYQYILKLAHIADEKISARGWSGKKPRSLATGQPVKGRKREGGQRCGEMEAWALLSHKAVNTLKELYFALSDDLKAQKTLKTSRELPLSFNPRTVKTAIDFLKSVFIELKLDRESGKVSLNMLSSEDIKKDAVEIKKWEELLQPENIDRFGYIELYEGAEKNEQKRFRFFHPWFISLIQGRHSQIVKKLLQGKACLVREGKRWYVKDFNELKKEDYVELNKTHKIMINLEAVKKFLEEPENEDALSPEWRREFRDYFEGKKDCFISKLIFDTLPVLPYRYRVWCDDEKFFWGKIYEKDVLYGRNYMIREHLSVEYGRILVWADRLKNKTADESVVQKRLVLLRSLNRFINFVIKKEIFSKEGLLRERILGKRIDRSGRAVIVPEPSLPINKVKLPSYICKELFEGIPDGKSLKVILNRQPTLHKYSMFSFEWEPSQDDCIHISPLICKPYNADFDGDQMAVYSPVSSQSQKELENMDITRHIISEANEDLNLSLSQDVRLGLYYIDHDFDWEEKEEKRLKQELRERLESLTERVKNKLEEETQNLDEFLAHSFSELAQVAFAGATFSSVSFSIFELDALKREFTQNQNWDYLFKVLTEDDWKKVVSDFKNFVETFMKNKFNSPALLIVSKARGDETQLSQLVIGRRYPMKMNSDSGEEGKNVVIFSSLLNGHNLIEYFLLSYIARDSLMDKKLSVAKAGYLTRKLVEASYNFRIIGYDCGMEGKDRTIFKCRLIPKGVCLKCFMAKGSQSSASHIYAKKTSENPIGLLRELSDKNRTYYEIGHFIGIECATFVGERGTQLTMQTFHKGAEREEMALTDLENLLCKEIECTEKDFKEVIEAQVERIKRGSKGSPYSKLKDILFYVIFLSRLKDGRIKGVTEFIKENFDLLHRISFESGKEHIVETLWKEKVHYIENLNSAKSAFFFMGTDLSGLNGKK